MRSTFKVLFYLKKNAPKKNGSVPVMCRITIDGTIAQFSCKCDIHPDLWDIKSNRASGKSTVALETNRFLDKIRVGINAKYKEIAERDNYVTAEKVKNAFLGLEMRHETLLKVFAQHNEDFFKQVNAGLRCPSTYNKYSTVYKHLEEFIKTRYRVSDIALKELTPVFITDFDSSKEERQRTDYRTYHYRPSCSPVQHQTGNKSGSLEREVRQGFRQNRRSRTYQFYAGKHPQHGTPTRLNG